MKKIFLIIAVLSATILSVHAQDVRVKATFNKTLTAYFNIKNALAKDNATLASQNTKILVANIDNFPTKKLSVSQQALWKTETDKIKTTALTIVNEKVIKEQRKSFGPLSSAMLKLVRELKLNSNEVYVQYCPMAKKSWLNEVKDVQNPFYGSMMYDCGEVTETIAKK